MADVVQDGGGSVGGPGRHRHLAADRLDREVAGEAFEPGRPGAGGEYHALGGDGVAGSAHAGHAAVGDPDLLDRLGNERRSEPAGVRQQRASQGLGIHGAVLRRVQGSNAFRSRGWPALVHVPGLQPVAAQSRLPLERHVLAELVHLGFRERHRGDPPSPEPDVDSGGIFQRGGQGLVMVSRPDAEAEQELVGGLDLRGQHPRRGRGGRGRVGARLEHGGVEPAFGSRAGAHGADHAAADDGDVSGRNPAHRAAVRVRNREWSLRRQPCFAASSASRCSRSSPGSA